MSLILWHILPLNSDIGGPMGYKQMDNNFSFTDLSLADSMEKNRSLSRMEKIHAIIT